MKPILKQTVLKQTVTYQIDSKQQIQALQITASDVKEGKLTGGVSWAPCINLLSFVSLLPNPNFANALLPELDIRRTNNVPIWSLHFEKTRRGVLFCSDTFTLNEEITVHFEKIHLQFWKDIPVLHNTGNETETKSLMRHSCARFVPIDSVCRYLKMMHPIIMSTFGGGGGGGGNFPQQLFDKMITIFTPFDNLVRKVPEKVPEKVLLASTSSAIPEATQMDLSSGDPPTSPMRRSTKRRRAVPALGSDAQMSVAAEFETSLAASAAVEKPSKKEKRDILCPLNELLQRFTDKETELKLRLKNFDNAQQIAEQRLKDKQKSVDTLKTAVENSETLVAHMMTQCTNLMTMQDQLDTRQKEVDKTHSVLLKKLDLF
jgi:hypothetical protein